MLRSLGEDAILLYRAGVRPNIIVEAGEADDYW